MQRDFCFSLSFQTKYLTLININQNYLIRTRLARTNSLAIVHSASYNTFSRLEVILRQNVGCSLITTGHEAPRSYQSAQGRITQGCGDDGYGSERPADKEGGLRTQGMRTEWQMGMERRSQEWEWRWRNDSTCGVCVYVRIYIYLYRTTMSAAAAGATLSPLWHRSTTRNDFLSWLAHRTRSLT